MCPLPRFALLQEIQRHPWFTEGLNPAVLVYNDGVLQQCWGSQPPAALLEEVRAWRMNAGAVVRASSLGELDAARMLWQRQGLVVGVLARCKSRA